MLENMFNKKMMGKMQEQMEEVKQKLNNISVVGEAENGAVKVTANGNRMIDSILLTDELINNSSKKQLEDFIIIAANRALEQAERVEKSEMSHAAMGIIPGLG